MCCTFGDLTDVQWWRELQLPTRSVVGRDGRILRETPGVARRPTAARARYEELAGKTTFSAREAVVAGLRESGDLDGEPVQHAAQGELLREGRQAPRDRHQPPVVHPQRRSRRGPARGAAGPRRRARVQPRLHEGPLRELGQRPQRRLAGVAAALLRRAVPGLVPARRRTASRSTTRRSLPTEDQLPIDPSSDVPAGYTADQRGVPGGFVGDPDIMDTWATSSLTPQIVGGWRTRPRPVQPRVPHGPAPPGPGHHPHLAVLHGGPLAPGARLAAVVVGGDQRLDPRPRPQEDVEVQGQRGHARWACSRSTAPTRSGTGPPRRAWARTPRSRSAR